MKHKLITVTLAMFMILVSAHAQEESASKTAKLNLFTSTNRPMAPSKVYIYCTYGQGYAVFDFSDAISELYITIADMDSVPAWYGRVDRDHYEVELPDSLMGTYTIECVTENGAHYYGELNF